MPKIRAVRITAPGGPEVLALEELSIRDPGPGEVLVEVAAAGLNRADLLQRRGLYPAPRGTVPDVPGLEHAGRVAALGPEVHGLAVGDRVMGIVAGGGMASGLVVHHRELIRVPEGLELTQAAAIPEAFLTAYDAMFEQAGLTTGETVLIHAVASGVGTAALQLARLAGARALGTSRSRDKLARCATLAPLEAIHVAEGRFAEEVLRLTGGRGVDVVIDLVGGPTLAENLEALAPRGRMIVLGLMAGSSAPLSLGTLLVKRLTVAGSVLRTRPLEEKAALAQRFGQRIAPLFASGGPLVPVIDAVLPMRLVAEAHARMEQNETFGKLVLTWEDQGEHG